LRFSFRCVLSDGATQRRDAVTTMPLGRRDDVEN
jgi:hypothetical protein